MTRLHYQAIHIRKEEPRHRKGLDLDERVRPKICIVGICRFPRKIQHTSDRIWIEMTRIGCGIYPMVVFVTTVLGIGVSDNGSVLPIKPERTTSKSSSWIRAYGKLPAWSPTIYLHNRLQLNYLRPPVLLSLHFAGILEL